MSIMHNINKSRVSLQHCTELKNILVIMELIIATLFDQVFIVRYLMLPRAFVLTQLNSLKKPFMQQGWLTSNTLIQMTNLVP
jgi:hypothetical protein